MEICGYPNYIIDLQGRVFSRRRGRFLKPTITKDGYIQVGLSKNKKQRKHLVHKLMVMTYLPNIFNHNTVKHKNNNKQDNRLYNLKWAQRRRAPNKFSSFINYEEGVYVLNVYCNGELIINTDMKNYTKLKKIRDKILDGLKMKEF